MASTTPKPQSDTSADPTPFDDRTRRVMELRRQIREGTYRPDSRAIARALLRVWAQSGNLLADPGAPGPADVPGDFRAAAERFVVRSGGPGEHTPAPEARTA